MNTKSLHIAIRIVSLLVAGLVILLGACGKSPTTTTRTTSFIPVTTTTQFTTSTTVPTTSSVFVTPSTTVLPSATLPTAVTSFTTTTPPVTTSTPPVTTPTTVTLTTVSPSTTSIAPTTSTTVATTPAITTPVTAPPVTTTTLPTSAATVPPEVTGITISLVAQGMAFDKKTITVYAGSNVVINFDNRDSVGHNFALYVNSSAPLPALFQGQVVNGPATATYMFKAPIQPGTYFFRCDVHPTIMTGTFIVIGTVS